VLNHIGLCVKAFVRLESHCYREKTSWIQAKTNVIRDAVNQAKTNIIRDAVKAHLLVESALFASHNWATPINNERKRNFAIRIF
jgi:hypothetical protein